MDVDKPQKCGRVCLPLPGFVFKALPVGVRNVIKIAIEVRERGKNGET
jgi:hypothetical protein